MSLKFHTCLSHLYSPQNRQCGFTMVGQWLLDVKHKHGTWSSSPATCGWYPGWLCQRQDMEQTQYDQLVFPNTSAPQQCPSHSHHHPILLVQMASHAHGTAQLSPHPPALHDGSMTRTARQDLSYLYGSSSMPSARPNYVYKKCHFYLLTLDFCRHHISHHGIEANMYLQGGPNFAQLDCSPQCHQHLLISWIGPLHHNCPAKVGWFHMHTHPINHKSLLALVSHLDRWAPSCFWCH